MNLGANAIIFVFNGGALMGRSKMLHGFFRAFHGGGQHESDGMKEAHARLCERTLCGEAQSLADIAQHHVGALNLRQGLLEGASDSFFHQTFAQAYAQIAQDDFDDVFGFAGSGPLQNPLQSYGLGRRAAR